MKAQTRKLTSVFTAAAAAAALVFAMAPAAFAADTNTGISKDAAVNQEITWAEAAENSGDTQYWMQLEESEMGKISIDVPVRVVLAVNADGTFVTPSALKNVIENDSEVPVNVSGMTVTTKDDFTLKAATGFDALKDANIFNGKVSSVALNAAGDDVESTKQSVAFSKIGDFVANGNWGMQASDGVEKSGDDCLFIQVDGAISNVLGHYFTAPINVFDITYEFEATEAAAVDNTSATSLPATAASIAD